MANRTKLTMRARGEFLRIIRETGNFSKAARGIGMSRRYLYQVKEKDEDLSQAWDEAEAEAIDALEREARCRAIEGVPQPVFYQGKVCGEIRKYSDRMLELLSKSQRITKGAAIHNI